MEPFSQKKVFSYFSHPDRPKATIAYFSQSPGGIYGIEKWWFWQGVINAGMERNINILHVSGSEFTREPQAVLYDLLDHNKIDGILAWQSFVSVHASGEEFLEFLSSYENIPVVTVETKLGNYPAVLIDNYFGMRKLIDHLVSVHHYQKIALFDQQLWHSNQRNGAYEQIMKEYGIFDPALVITETQLIEQLKKFPNEKLGFEFIISTVDNSALYLLNLFQTYGVRVPDDVGINGYNDGRAVRLSNPSITAVSLPFYRMGYQSTSILCDQIQGRPVPSLTYIPLGLSIRQSCGCHNQMITRLNSKEPKELPFSAVWTQRGRIIRDMLNAAEIHHRSRLRVWINQLLNTFLHALSENEDDLVFINVFGQILDEFNLLDEESMDFNHILTIMRNELLPYIDRDHMNQFGTMLEKARIIIAQKAVEVLDQRNQLYLRRTEVLREIERSNMLGQSMDQFLENLSTVIPRMEIPGFYFMTYNSPENPLGEATLRFAFRQGQQIPLPHTGITFLSQDLLPSVIQNQINNNLFLLEALHVEEDQMGYLIYELDNTLTESEGMVFSIFTTQISSALKGIHLREEIRQAWLLSEERRVAAEEANQLKSRFLSLVSHELRNPLNLILNNSELAAKYLDTSNTNQEVKPNHPEQQHVYLSRIINSAKYLNALIGDVLDLTKSQMGGITLNKKPTNLNYFLSEIADMALQMCQAKGLHFISDVTQNLPDIAIDRDRFNQVMLNLVSNAVKFTEVGEIRLEVNTISDTLRIAIHDTGIGIPREEQELIFNEFRQSQRTSTRGFGGMGLGLAIARYIVELHQGKIRVQSSGVEGKGSTFEILLPLTASTSTLLNQPDNGLKKIVLLSDNQKNIQTLKTLTELKDWEIEIISTPENRNSDQNFTRPDLLLVDLSADNTQSFQLLEQMQEQSNFTDVPMIFLKDDQPDLRSIMPLSTLNKPFAIEELEKIIANLVAPIADGNFQNRILIVDDDPHLLATEAELITARFPNCELFTAANGLEAVRSMQENIPDLVLLDLMMPELDGFGVINEMQKTPSLMSIPVIILTAQALQVEDLYKFEKGVLSILQKGVVDSNTLVNRIESILNKESTGQYERRRLVRKAIVHIHQNFQNPFSRFELAQKLGVSEDYLTHCFSEELGMPPNKYINRFRIEQAKAMMRDQSAISITQIALETGFSSQAYFSRVFRKETGQTPMEYRATIS